MYHNPLTKDEEYQELIKEIENKSIYKRLPSAEKKYMTVPEMGRLLGLKKTDRYWLVHKNVFKTEIIMGKMCVELKSFEKWYANQVKYHKITGEEPGLELKQQSYSARDIAEILQISEWQVYGEMKKAGVAYILVDYWKRFPKEAFDEWYKHQNHFRNAEDREKVKDIIEGSMRMPEMARMLGVPRSVVYDLIRHSDILQVIELDGRKRITKESFYTWYASQEKYRMASSGNEEAVDTSIEAHRAAVLDRDGNTKHIGNDEYLTVPEAAILVGVSPATINKWIKKAKIKAIKSSKTIRIPRKQFEEWLQSREKEN